LLGDREGRIITEKRFSQQNLRKVQVKRLDGRDTVGQAEFVRSLFGVAA
jgi:hypothetical protein